MRLRICVCNCVHVCLSTLCVIIPLICIGRCRVTWYSCCYPACESATARAPSRKSRHLMQVWTPCFLHLYNFNMGRGAGCLSRSYGGLWGWIFEVLGRRFYAFLYHFCSHLLSCNATIHIFCRVPLQSTSSLMDLFSSRLLF